MTNKEIVLAAMESIGRAEAKGLVKDFAAGTVKEAELPSLIRMVPSFDPNKDYSGAAVGTPVQDGGEVYTLIQPYNASYYPGTRPADIPAIWKHIAKLEISEPVAGGVIEL